MKSGSAGVRSRHSSRLAVVVAFMIMAVGQSSPSGGDGEDAHSSLLAAIDAVLVTDDELTLELGRWRGVSSQSLIPGPQDQSMNEPRLWQVRGQLRGWSMSKRLRAALGRLKFEETQSAEPCPDGLRVAIWRGGGPALLLVVGDDGSVCRFVGSGTYWPRYRAVGKDTNVLYEIALELISPLVAGELRLEERCLEGFRGEQLQ